MLAAAGMGPSPPPQGAETRGQRRRRLLAPLQAAAAPLLGPRADTLADAPDRETFRSVEARLRGWGHQVAAFAQQAGLDGRGKGAT